MEYLGWLEVRNLTNLPSLDALASLTTINESLELAFNDLMTEVCETTRGWCVVQRVQRV